MVLPKFMPPYVRGVGRPDLIYVRINEFVLYGFARKDLTKIPGVTAADITPLGHLTAAAAGGTAGAILCLGANAPKPARVRKRLGNAVTAQGSVSTFCSYNALAAAAGAGWRLVKPVHYVSLSGPSAGRRGQTVIAELSNGTLYAFSMNTADVTAYAGALGLQAAAAVTTDVERKKLVRGSNVPRPGKAGLEVAVGGGTPDTPISGFSRFESFYSTNAELTGFDRLSDEVIIAVTGDTTP